jgi:hypothetical protein
LEGRIEGIDHIVPSQSRRGVGLPSRVPQEAREEKDRLEQEGQAKGFAEQQQRAIPPPFRIMQALSPAGKTSCARAVRIPCADSFELWVNQHEQWCSNASQDWDQNGDSDTHAWQTADLMGAMATRPMLHRQFAPHAIRDGLYHAARVVPLPCLGDSRQAKDMPQGDAYKPWSSAATIVQPCAKSGQTFPRCLNIRHHNCLSTSPQSRIGNGPA